MKKVKQKQTERGITLIALIVTIIIMIIIAAIAISMLTGDSGIVTLAINAKYATIIASEREAIQLVATEALMNDNSSSYVGKALHDKTLDSGGNWDIVVINDTQEVYGTDWYYISTGTEISSYGETEYAWLVNYETQKIIQLTEGNYTRLDYSSKLAVTDGLILNIDPSVVEGVSTEELKSDTSILGNNVTLVNFDWTEDSGLTSTSFNFDGVDDYIQIKVSKNELTGLLEEGLTFEYYGSCLEGNHTYYDGTTGTDSFVRTI